MQARALAAAVAQAAALAPEVAALLEKVAEGVFLLPRQQKLLLFGIHALAAARETSAFPAFAAVLRRSGRAIGAWLGDELVESLTGLLLGLYDGNADPLLAAIEDPSTDGEVKWSLFQVLARLCWEGRASRERFIDLIDRFDRDASAPPGDFAWMGWQDAIMYLGLIQFEERVRRGWEAGRAPHFREVDQQDWHERLERAASHPDDPRCFVDDGVVAMTDPVASFAWMAEEREATAEDGDGSEDPAAAIALTPSELDWLEGFLDSEQVPDTTMSLEELDGFFAALIAGPALILPSEYMERLWGTESGEGPIFDSDEQLQLFMDLLTRHWNTIAERLNAGFPHAPLLQWSRPEDRARGWAEGFAAGVALRPDEWTPLLKNKKSGVLAVSILALAFDDGADEEQPATEERAEITEMLPVLLLGIRTFFRERESGAHTPIRAVKVGRNEPCPCGSGKKYKRCCGA